MTTRISTLGFQTAASQQMQTLDSQIAQTQQELSTGLQLQNAADNPAGMAQVNQLDAQISASKQYQSNGSSLNSNLTFEEQSLTDATNVLQSARDLAVQANNASLSATQRQDIATQLSQLQEQLVATANSTDANGAYLFGGDANTTPPFTQNGTTVTYNGSNSVNQVQISANQRVSASDSGASVFMNIPAGNGTFTTTAGAANTGTGVIDTGTVTNASQWVPDTYTITFSTPTSYTVTNSEGATVTSGTYSDPTSIAFDGISTTITGSPAAGDTYTVAPAGTSSAFNTLSTLITTLNNSNTSTSFSIAIPRKPQDATPPSRLNPTTSICR